MRRRPVHTIAVAAFLAATLAASVAGVTAPAWARPPLPGGCSASSLQSDFNGDGSGDAAVADPAATVGGQTGAGRLVVLYGDGIDSQVGNGVRETLSQNTAGISGSAETGDGFGAALAAADLNCDDYTDLVVGTPGEDVAGRTDSGVVQVIFGGPEGLNNGPEASVQYDQTSFGLTAHAGDQLGYALDALEDAGQDGTDAPSAYALAIGVPGWDLPGAKDAGGAAFVVPWDGNSVRTFLTQNSPHVPGAAETGDRFGSTVTLNYLDDGDSVDAAVGAPLEDDGSIKDSGAVTVLTSLTDEGATAGIGLSQSSPGVPGAAEVGDRFGATLDALDFDRKTSYLAVGVPGEDLGSAADAGVVQVFRQGVTTPEPYLTLSQDTAGVAGVAEAGDQFGAALSFGGQYHDDLRLLVGVPGEDLGALADAGAAQVFILSAPGSNGETYTQDSPGVPGVAQSGDRFGSTVAVVYDGEDLMLVGVPDDVTYGSGLVEAIPFESGTDRRAWIPGVGGVPASASRFGATIAAAGGSF